MEISENQIECLFEFCDTGSEAYEEFKASSVKLSYSLNNVLLTNKGSPDVRSLKESDKNDSDESSISRGEGSFQNLDSKACALLEEIKRSESNRTAKPKRIYRKVLNMLSSTSMLRILIK